MGVFNHAATAADAEDKPLPLTTNQYAICRYVGGQIRAGQEGCEKSRPTPLLYRRTFQPGTSYYSNYGIKALLDVATGVVFIVDAFSTSDIFLQLRITHTYSSPVSLHNTVYHARSISLLFQYTTLYIPHALFLSCFSTKYCTCPKALFLSCFSTHHSISPTLYFSPVSVHNTVYHRHSISLVFQYTTLYITHALFLSCFSTQHCISPTLYFSPVVSLSLSDPEVTSRSMTSPTPTP